MIGGSDGFAEAADIARRHPSTVRRKVKPKTSNPKAVRGNSLGATERTPAIMKQKPAAVPITTEE